MRSHRSIIVFWALFLVPTLIMAGAAFKLLVHEQDRITESATMALAERAGAVCETIHLAVEVVQENLTRALMALDPAALENQLIRWEATNPLVRNVFVLKKGNEASILEYPVRGMASTSEERKFISRYDALFSGRVALDFNKARNKETRRPSGYPQTGAGSFGAASESSDEDRLAVKEKSSRKILADLSRIPQRQVALTQGETSDFSASGWIPWFSENQLYILGWVQKYESGPVYGVELELVCVLSRLVVDFPVLSNENHALVLKDGNGRFLHRTGGFEPDEAAVPDKMIPVSALLPHWQMAVYINHTEGVAANGFLYLSLLLLGVFIAAIVSGGILLTRMTLWNIQDARQKTSFVASVSHELKTPLTSIRMYAELLLSKRVKDKTKVDHYLSVIVDESHRLTRLINNVLDFGRLEQKKKKYQLSRIELDRLLERIINAHSIRAKDLGIEINTRFENRNFSIRTDRDAIEQVILNLLDNALKYASDGRYIQFVLEKENADILLRICDDGPGIPKKEQAAIFDKFYRVDNSLSAKQPGSGLGLSIARQILQDLGGDLFFEPMPERGSCFTARIKDNESN